MARTFGALGVVKSEFERDFYQECKRRKIKPGVMAAVMLEQAFDAGERREFAVLLKMALDQTSDPVSPAQQVLPLVVVDRRQDDRRQLQASEGEYAAIEN